jgi:hypothetical protein
MYIRGRFKPIFSPFLPWLLRKLMLLIPMGRFCPTPHPIIINKVTPIVFGPKKIVINFIKTTVQWHMTPFNLVDRCRGFKVPCCLYFQCRWAFHFTRLRGFNQETYSMHGIWQMYLTTTPNSEKGRWIAYRPVDYRISFNSEFVQ